MKLCAWVKLDKTKDLPRGKAVVFFGGLFFVNDVKFREKHSRAGKLFIQTSVYNEVLGN